METLVPAAICHHGRIRVETERAIEFIDLTTRIEALTAEAGIHAGLVNIRACTPRRQSSSTNTSRCCSRTSTPCSPGRRRGTRPIATMTWMPGP